MDFINIFYLACYLTCKSILVALVCSHFLYVSDNFYVFITFVPTCRQLADLHKENASKDSAAQVSNRFITAIKQFARVAKP